jgi:hypothetical protein
MHTLWFPKWLLRRGAPLLAVPLVRAMLGDMEEPTQRERAYKEQPADVGKQRQSPQR